jgi:hypothetical protein
VSGKPISQTITHTPADRAEIVDCGKLVEIAQALAALVEKGNHELHE